MKPTELEDLVVYAEGLLYASVCSSLPIEEVEQRMARQYNGTKLGWQLAEKKFATGEDNPCVCERGPATHRHYLFTC